jgi:hypothetical protein
MFGLNSLLRSLTPLVMNTSRSSQDDSDDLV